MVKNPPLKFGWLFVSHNAITGIPILFASLIAFLSGQESVTNTTLTSIKFLKPIQAKIKHYESNPKEVDKILNAGAKQAQKIANKNIKEIKKIVGLN